MKSDLEEALEQARAQVVEAREALESLKTDQSRQLEDLSRDKQNLVQTSAQLQVNYFRISIQ